MRTSAIAGISRAMSSGTRVGVRVDVGVGNVRMAVGLAPRGIADVGVGSISGTRVGVRVGVGVGNLGMAVDLAPRGIADVGVGSMGPIGTGILVGFPPLQAITRTTKATREIARFAIFVEALKGFQ